MSTDVERVEILPWNEDAQVFSDVSLALDLTHDQVLGRFFTGQELADFETRLRTEREANISFVQSLSEKEYEEYLELFDPDEEFKDPEAEFVNVLNATRDFIQKNVEVIPGYVLSIYRGEYATASAWPYSNRNARPNMPAYTHTVKFLPVPEGLERKSRLYCPSDDTLNLDDLPEISVPVITGAVIRAIKVLWPLRELPKPHLIAELGIASE